MSSDNPILKQHKQPIQSGIHRRLITRQYKLGSAFLIKDGESYYNTDLIKHEKVVLQFT